MFYNELSAKYLFWTCKGIHSVFFRYFSNYLVAVSTWVSHKWPRYVVSLFEIRTPLHVFFVKIVVVSLIIYAENLGTAIFKKQFSKPSFELWSNLWIQPVKQLVFTRVAGLQLQRYTYLDHLSKQQKIAAVITVEYNLPTNLFEINSIEGVQTKGTEQCNFVKCLLILIARKHKKMCPFIEKWVNCNCLLVYNSLYALL